MDIQEFTDILEHPEKITSEQTEAINNIISKYPYFQPARALYLKGLKNKSSFKYNHALKLTAAHTTDRSVLFDFITSEVFNQNEISDSIKQNAEYIKTLKVNEIDDISVNKSVEIDDALRQQIKETEGVLDPNLFKAKEPILRHNTNTSEIKNDDEHGILAVDTANITPENTLNLGKPLEFDKSETHSFVEWLKITDFKPIEREEQTNTESTKDTKSEPPLQKKIDIIDRFIEENPKISPVKDHTPKINLIANDDSDINSLMTETLARIYVEQKNYDKAIQSYKILSLKYPEKSSFFASQIKAVEELKAKNNI